VKGAITPAVILPDCVGTDDEEDGLLLPHAARRAIAPTRADTRQVLWEPMGNLLVKVTPFRRCHVHTVHPTVVSSTIMDAADKCKAHRLVRVAVRQPASKRAKETR
jgi:hypothetical protein